MAGVLAVVRARWAVGRLRCSRRTCSARAGCVGGGLLAVRTVRRWCASCCCCASRGMRYAERAVVACLPRGPPPAWSRARGARARTAARRPATVRLARALSRDASRTGRQADAIAGRGVPAAGRSRRCCSWSAWHFLDVGVLDGGMSAFGIRGDQFSAGFYLRDAMRSFSIPWSRESRRERTTTRCWRCWSSWRQR